MTQTTQMQIQNIDPNFTFADGRTVNRLGFGTMRLTGQPGNFGPYEDWNAGIAVIRAAREAGVQVFDTARAYGPAHAERILADAIPASDTDAFIVTKGGVTKTGVGPGHIRADARPEQLAREIEASLRDLKRERIDLYFLHRPDPSVPFADQIGALETARQAGKIARIGLSNVSLDQLKAAMDVATIDAVQNRYDPVGGGDDGVLDFATRHGMAFLPWGPLGANPMTPGSPLHGPAPVDGPTAIQTALADLLARSPNMIPIPGTTRRAHACDNARALAAVQAAG
ncbi:MAG: aldo/keto reductase [Pseudomonadota bacterium]